MITFQPTASAITADAFQRQGNSFDPDIHIIATTEDAATAEWTQYILDKYADEVTVYSVMPAFGTDTFVIELQFADTPAGRATARECLREYKSGFRRGGAVVRKKKEVNTKTGPEKRKRLLKDRMYLLPNGQYFWYYAHWDYHGNVIGKVAPIDRPGNGGVPLESKIIHRSDLEKAEIVPKGQEPWLFGKE